ncbi:MAG: caspase family protein [Crocinitomicaceae bacterium]|nr:caspase family protein [Crocinitomicaceae bacterium]
MKLKLLNISVLTCVLTLNFAAKAQEDNVQVVIATGLSMSQASAFSSDNRFVAQALYDAVTIWDVKTGRMIRNVNYADNISKSADSIWFSEDNTKLIVGMMMTHDTYEVDIATGKSTLITGPAFDYNNYTYQQPIRITSNIHLYSGKKTPLEYKAPDGKSSLVYKIIPNPYGNTNLVPHAYEVHTKYKGKLGPAVDTVMHAIFAFSPDSKYAFLESHIVDLETAKTISALKIVPYSGWGVIFLPGTRTAVTCGVENIRIWDFPDVQNVKVKGLINFMPSADKKYVICETYNENMAHREYFPVDVEKKKKAGRSVKTNETSYLLDVSPDGKYYAFLEQGKAKIGDMQVHFKVKICESKSGKIVREIDNANKVLFTADPNIIITDSIGMINRKLNLETGEVKIFPNEKNGVGSASRLVDDSNKYLMGSTMVRDENGDYHTQIIVWDILTEERVFETSCQGIDVSAFNVSQDEKYVSFATSAGFNIYVHNFQTGERLHTLEAHTSFVQQTRFSDDGLRLISSSYDGSRRVWNLEKGYEMVSLINTGPNDYAIVTPSQYYYATKGAKRLIHFVKGINIYPFSQFDLKYNRPDIIIQSMEASNQDLIKPFYYAYKKRLKRLGFTEEMLDGTFHLPTASITNSMEIPVKTEEGKLKLNIAAVDEKYNLDRLLVRVNEVPIHGKNGIPLRSKSLKDYNNEIDIILSEGKNFIDVSVMNEKGVESVPSNVVIDYQPEKSRKPNLYLYTIGVSEYEQSDFNLTYAAKDASDIQSLYNGPVEPFSQVITKELTNEQVTLESIKGIKEELMKTHVDDAVCVFFAGHGILDVELNYFLASYDIDFKDPANRGIPYEVFEDILDEIPARKKLIMIDACHSGEIDKEEVAMVEEENATDAGSDVNFRAVNSTSLKRVGLNNSFELMKELFNDVRKSSGTVIISSAGGMEYAMEGGEWNNGVFTYCFLNGIKNGKADINSDGKIMLSEMNSFVRTEVFNLTDGRQQPTNRAEVLENDWRIW